MTWRRAGRPIVGADMSDDGDLPAGDFASWLNRTVVAIRGEADAEVPCGGCTACCTSFQFVPIGPDETDTLAHIPAELLFSAPRMPKGHVLLGYDQRGHCPMLVDDRCSIYEHRPRTCRTYDCRVFTATGLAVDDDDPGKTQVARRTRRWRFSFPGDEDRRRHDAVRAAVTSLRAEADSDGDVGAGRLLGARPTNVTRLAVRAIETHEEFMS